MYFAMTADVPVGLDCEFQSFSYNGAGNCDSYQISSFSEANASGGRDLDIVCCAGHGASQSSAVKG